MHFQHVCVCAFVDEHDSDKWHYEEVIFLACNLLCPFKPRDKPANLANDRCAKPRSGFNGTRFIVGHKRVEKQ